MNQQSTLVGLFKEVYASSIIEAWGYMAKLANKVKFVPSQLQPGNYYHQPVDVALEQGISYAGAGTTIGVGSSYFFPATAGMMQDAQIAGAQLLARALVSYEAIARSANDKAAFKSATQHVVRRLSQAVLKRLEIQLLHGQRGVGAIASLAAETGSSGAYFSVLTLTDASFSAGLWAGMQGALVDVYQSDLATIRQAADQNNGATSGTTGWCVVSAVDQVNKTVTLNYGTARSGWVAGDVLFFGGAVGGASSTEFAGLDAITRWSASSGTQMNIATGTYDLWRSNQYSSTSTISFGKILEACGLMASYGLQDDSVCVLPTKAFEILNTDLAALRQYDVSYTSARAESGTEALKFHAQTGPVEIMAHPFQKDGLGHLFVPSESIRVGATDISFITRQGSEDKLILESSTAAASEMRAYSNQALFLGMPRHSVLMDGITY